MAKATINPGTLHPSGLASTGLSPKSRPYDGGPAFPSPSVGTSDGGRMPSGYPGVSLRAYFAANAPMVPDKYPYKLVPGVASGAYGTKSVVSVNEPDLDRAVRWCLEFADAMLKEVK